MIKNIATVTGKIDINSVPHESLQCVDHAISGLYHPVSGKKLISN